MDPFSPHVSGDQGDKNSVNREVHAGIRGSRGVKIPRPPDPYRMK
jgi:hypothetical protein